MNTSYDIVIFGLSITSSWGNGHATTWRSLVRGLAIRGHRILFLERDAPWYAANRDAPQPRGATTIVYNSTDELFARFEEIVSEAALVIVGSYVPDGLQIGQWVTSIAHGNTAFYDIDTPITLAALETKSAEYISAALIPQYDAYFSFTGGPILRAIEARYGSPMARALYCSVDQELYRPQPAPIKWDLGYLGTYSSDRQPVLESLLLNPAVHSPTDRFVVAGPQYPADLIWPANVERITHLSPLLHPAFYAAQRFTLNITRDAMRKAGYSPSVRLFEAAACGVPIISDWWEGLDTIFQIGKEILLAESETDVSRFLNDTPESKRMEVGHAARHRVLNQHTSAARAAQLELYWKEMNGNPATGKTRRHRRYRQTAGRVDVRLVPEQCGPAASSASGPEPVGVTNLRDLHKSIRKGV